MLRSLVGSEMCIRNRLTGGLVHLKTAGTSYLEALRAVAKVAPAFFRKVYALSLIHI